MDGAITSYGAETPRHLAAQWQLTGESAAVQGGLFEQLLNLTLAVPATRNDDSSGSDHLNDDSSFSIADEATESSRSEEERAARDTEDQQTEETGGEVTVVPLTNNLETIQVAETTSAQETQPVTVEQSPLETTQQAQAPTDDSAGEQTLELQTDSNPATQETHSDENSNFEHDFNESRELEAATQDQDQSSIARQRQRRETQDNQGTAEIVDAAPQVVEEPVADQSEPTDDEQIITEPHLAKETPPDDAQPRDRQSREKWYQRDADANPFGANDSAEDAAASASAIQDKTLGEHGSELPSGRTDAEAQNQRAAAKPSPDTSEFITTTERNPTAIVPSAASGSSAIVVSGLAAASGNSGDTAQPGNIANSSSGSSSVEAKATSKPIKAVSETDQAPDLTQQERVRLVQRISRSFARLGPMGGQVNIKLHPPQLGSLNVQVRLEGRSMTAKLSTENAAARDAILESLPVLRGRLAEQGFEISQFQVEVASNDTNAANGGSQSQFGQSENHGDGFQRRYVDYRRVNASQRVTGSERAATTVPATNPLAWQTMAGIDMQA